MQLRTFIKKLQDLESNGYSRAAVTINKKTFNHPLEQDGVCILDINTIEGDYILQIGDDGFTKVRKDGQECYRKCVVIKGEI